MNAMNFLGYVIIFIFVLYLFTRIRTGPFIFLTSEKHIVFIKDFEFIPGDIEINVGDTVFWINKDQVRHVIKADEEFMPNSNILLYNEEHQHTFANTGTYTFSSTLYKKVKPMMITVRKKDEKQDESFYETIIRNTVNLLFNLYKNIIYKIYDIVTFNY
jgi:hypothetical protein